MPDDASQRPILADSFWRAPLVPAAVAFTAGIVYDRFYSPPLPACLLFAGVCMAAWLLLFATLSRPDPALLYLIIALAPLGAAYHHYCRNIGPTDLLGGIVGDKPVSVELRGFLDEEPSDLAPGTQPSRWSRSQDSSWRTVLLATSWKQNGRWQPCTDRVRVIVPGEMLDLHEGDEVEVSGRLSAIAGPKNPGEFDLRGYYADQGIHTRLQAWAEPPGVVRLRQRWPESYRGWLAVIRGWGQQTLTKALPTRVGAGLANALVLGDGSGLNQDNWGRYKRTGVIHVLVISGQHLVLLAAILLWIMPRLGCRLTVTAWTVGLLMVFYILLTGARPPGVRSAVAMCAWYGGWILRRRIVPANIFALAWLFVAVLNPMDIFTAGCQLSFLSVLILYRIGLLWEQQERATLDNQDARATQKLLQRLQSPASRFLVGLWHAVKENYKIGLFVWLGVTPLVAWHYHLVPFIALLLGPPVSFLTTIALLAGFAALALGALHLPGVGFCAIPLRWSLDACDFLVNWADRLGWGYSYIPDVPAWWFVGYYAALGAFLTLHVLRQRWRAALLAGLAWLCLGLLVALVRVPTGELRCTFLAVGHGGCTVMELPDGRVFLYDAGAITGPQVAENQIAPFLWQRGIRAIDEVLLSHADWDHYNGLIGLLDRFAVGQVTCTPTFAEKDTEGVGQTVEMLKRRRVPMRIVQAGDRLLAGGGVTMQVLHPPAVGPEGNENSRSLTLRVVHEGNAILLTGDLEGLGLERVLGLLKVRIDVLMAPHHGSRRIDAEGLVARTQPWLIVSSQGPPLGKGGYPEAYLRKGLRFWPTLECGAITIRSHATGLVAERFLDGEREARARKTD